MLRQDLLEAGEENAVLGAILWLAQTILETLLPTGELDAWLQRAGLTSAIGELKSEVERIETVVNGVEGRAVGNKPLARSLARVKELMYDADDVVDELDYCRLQQQVQGVLPISLSKYYHLEVLDVGQPVIVDGTSDLVNMRNLILSKGACGVSSPAWFSCLQTIHLEDHEGWEILPSLERLSHLTKLKLRNLPNVTEMSIPSLEELVLIDMRKLDRCLSNSVRDLNSSLRVLEIRACWVLKAFPLFESYEKFGIGQKSWLPNISELTIHECPHLVLSNPLPPSSSLCKLSIRDVSTLPTIEGSSNGEVKFVLCGDSSFIELLDENDSMLLFDNLRTITRLKIVGCGNLWSFSFEYCELIKFQGNKEGFSRFTSLEELRIVDCPELIPSLVHEYEIDDQANRRWLLPCSLGVLDIRGVSLETLQPSFSGDLTRLTVLKVSRIHALKSLQLHSCTALEKLTIGLCESLDALEGFQSLRNLSLPQCLKSLSTQVYELCPRLERLRFSDLSLLTKPFCKHLTSLQCLQLEYRYKDNDAAGLTWEQEAALQLLASLQHLQFHGYHKLSDLPVGLHSLLSLKRLQIFYCPNISRLLERGLPPSLEELEVCGCISKVISSLGKVGINLDSSDVAILKNLEADSLVLHANKKRSIPKCKYSSIDSDENGKNDSRQFSATLVEILMRTCWIRRMIKS
ncbi:hypothetical protein SORBI_3009G220800 [Sorghum bicolor]|uniref:Disease resistance N-terminal domain-containing protein n=1 Tax=Sorghum bicolor TaxID=4558 RepID=A0A1B6P9Q0_SORBI|nr:hypothetical protein SORBI_3009G220800 [Sorghum bicolor]